MERQNAAVAAADEIRRICHVENLTFFDYYTVKEKVKESQSQR